MKLIALAPLAVCGLILSACGDEDAAAPASDEAAATGSASETQGAASAEAAATPASMTAEQADQAFRCNALFVAAVTGRITGQRALPADLDPQVRPMGQAFWQERENAAIAALGLSEAEVEARRTADGERVYGRATLSEEDITDLRACVAAMS